MDDGDAKCTSRSHIHRSVFRHLSMILETLSWGINFLRPAAFVAINTGISLIAFNLTCLEVNTYLRLYVVEATNSAGSSPISWRESYLSYSAILQALHSIKVGTRKEWCGTIILLVWWTDFITPSTKVVPINTGRVNFSTIPSVPPGYDSPVPTWRMMVPEKVIPLLDTILASCISRSLILSSQLGPKISLNYVWSHFSVRSTTNVVHEPEL